MALRVGGLSVGRWTTLWRAITGWREGPLAIEDIPLLRAYLCMGDPAAQPDWYINLGVRLGWFNFRQVAGGAGTFNHLVVLNPNNSGVVVVVTDWWVHSDTGAGGVFVGPRSRLSVNPPAAFTQTNNFIGPLDGRNVTPLGGGVFTASAQLWTLTDATANYRGTTADFMTPAGISQGRKGPWILAPGDALVIENVTAVQALNCGGLFYERDLDTGERRS